MYHASKWGIEGFMESTAKDVAPFGIGVTIVEPGSARTRFRDGSSRLATPMSAYDGSPAALTRGIRNPALPSVGNVAKTAAAILGCADLDPAPLRVALRIAHSESRAGRARTLLRPEPPGLRRTARRSRAPVPRGASPSSAAAAAARGPGRTRSPGGP
ncbi:hypothetical protein GCM10027161_62300 [Microbispora hainanensis]